MTNAPARRGPAASQGLFNSSSFPKQNVIELVNFRWENCIPMNIIDTGISTGAGTTGTYPTEIYDGIIMGKASLSQYNSAQKTALDISATGRRNGTYFDCASGGTTKNAIALLFTGNLAKAQGADNVFHETTGSASPLANAWTGAGSDVPTLKENFRPGKLDNNGYTGLVRGQAWITKNQVTTRSLSGFAVNDVLTVSNGLFKKGVAASGEYAYGDVLEIIQTGSIYKMLIRWDFTNGHVI